MKDENLKPEQLLELTNKEARKFFLKHESYFNGDLPPYFQFEQLLNDVSTELGDQNLNGLFGSIKPKDSENVNHVIVANKDGKLSWRPLQLIHPLLYVNLVSEITTVGNWDKLKIMFGKMHSCEKITCLSMPMQAHDDLKDRAEQVSHWWQSFELKSIELSLDYNYIYETDITDCYGSFYTHSIAWAVEGKDIAKSNRNTKNLGNFIDKAIQDMQHGQTNGIPQGSVLMDFIAEMILGYADIEIMKKLEAENIDDFKILRYRDDYRVFVNSSESGESILKIISEVLTELGLRLNSNKTKFSSDVINASMKEDKKSWFNGKEYHKSLFKHSMLIKKHADAFVNSGSLVTALSKLHRRIIKIEEVDITSKAIISVIIDIAYKNPRSYPVCFAILSKYLTLFDEDVKNSLINKIQLKFNKLPNIGYMELWFQRAIIGHPNEIEFNEPLCKMVMEENVKLWNSDWIGSIKLKNIIDAASLIDKSKLAEVEPFIESLEFNLFLQFSG